MYLLLKDYFRRYRAVFGVFAAVEIYACTVLLLFTDKELAFLNPAADDLGGDLLSRVQFFFIILGYAFAVVAHSAAYILTLLFMILVAAELGGKWPRAALTLPVSRNTAATTLWMECVVIPTILMTVAGPIIASCDRYGVLSAEVLASTAPGLADHGFTESFFGSLCFAGTVCLLIEFWDVVGRQYAKRGSGPISSLICGLTILFSMVATGVYLLLLLGVLGLVTFFETSEAFSVFKYIMIALGLSFVAASYFLRQSLLQCYEAFRGAGAVGWRAKHPRAPAAKGQSNYPFLRSYVRVARFVALVCLVCYAAVFLCFLLLGGHIHLPQQPQDDLEKWGGFILTISIIASIALSLGTTPPMRVCRCLPLRPHQILIHCVAYPATIFATTMVSMLPVMYFLNWLETPQPYAIHFAAFGFAVFLLGLFSFASNGALLVATLAPMGTLLLVIVLLGKNPFESIIEATIQSASATLILGCILLALGLFAWTLGITRSSLAYNALMRRDQGKFVF